MAHPTSVMVDTFGSGKLSNEKLVEIIRENFDLRPAGIIKMLDLRRPIYKQTAAYGHFGRNDLDLPWEKLDKVSLLKKIFIIFMYKIDAARSAGYSCLAASFSIGIYSQTDSQGNVFADCRESEETMGQGIQAF